MDKQLTPRQLEIINDLLDNSALIKKSLFGSGFYYEKYIGDRPSNFTTHRVAVHKPTMDSLFLKGWIKKANMQGEAYEAVVPEAQKI